MIPLFGVSFGGILLALVLFFLALAIIYWVVMFLFIKRGRAKRAKRLAENPNAYEAIAPQQDWGSKQE